MAYLNKKKYSIRLLFLLTLFATSVTVILIMAFSGFFIYLNQMIDVIGTNRADVLSQIAGRIKDTKSSAYTLSNLYYHDRQFKAYTQALTEDNIDAFSEYMNRVTEQYKLSFNQINLNYHVVYVSRDGIGYCSVPVPEDYDYMNPTIRIWYKDIYRGQGQPVDVASYQDKFLGTSIFVVARTVLDGSGEILGYLMINVDEDQIYQTYQDSISDPSTIYICDDKGYIISSNNRKITGFQYFHMGNLRTIFGSDAYSIVDHPSGKQLLTRYVVPDYGFTVFEQAPLKSILEPIVRIRDILIVIGVCVICFAGFVAWFLSGKLTKPIVTLRNYLLSVEEGDLELAPPELAVQELNTLSMGLGEMLSKIRGLMESERQKEIQKRKLHYHMLQAQINPHFMYNTLFSIKCVVDMDEKKKASQMLSAFIQFLRNILSNPDKLVTIRRQMETLQQYVDLQRFRYGESFDVIIEYDERLEDYLIPAFLIQPVLENAIIHGIGQMPSGGVIAVTVRQKDEKVVIEVEDNGCGMTQKRMEEILSAESGAHIGIGNIRQRIQLLYGDGYGLHMESMPEEGTKVFIDLPLISEEGVELYGENPGG